MQTKFQKTSISLFATSLMLSLILILVGNTIAQNVILYVREVGGNENHYFLQEFITNVGLALLVKPLLLAIFWQGHYQQKYLWLSVIIDIVLVCLIGTMLIQQTSNSQYIDITWDTGSIAKINQYIGGLAIVFLSHILALYLYLRWGGKSWATESDSLLDNEMIDL